MLIQNPEYMPKFMSDYSLDHLLLSATASFTKSAIVAEALNPRDRLISDIEIAHVVNSIAHSEQYKSLQVDIPGTKQGYRHHLKTTLNPFVRNVPRKGTALNKDGRYFLQPVARYALRTMKELGFDLGRINIVDRDIESFRAINNLIFKEGLTKSRDIRDKLGMTAGQRRFRATINDLKNLDLVTTEIVSATNGNFGSLHIYPTEKGEQIIYGLEDKFFSVIENYAIACELGLGLRERAKYLKTAEPIEKKLNIRYIGDDSRVKESVHGMFKGSHQYGIYLLETPISERNPTVTIVDTDSAKLSLNYGKVIALSNSKEKAQRLLISQQADRVYNKSLIGKGDEFKMYVLDFALSNGKQNGHRKEYSHKRELQPNILTI